MARITVPEAVFYTRVDLYLDYTRQILLRSEWSTRKRFINRSYPEWAGTITIGEPLNEEEGRAIAGWLSGFNGQANTFLLEHQLPTLEDTVSATVASSASRSDGVLEHTLSGALTDAEVGMAVAAGDKLYQIRELAGNNVVLDPQRPIPDGITVAHSTTVEVRSASPIHPSNPHTPSFWGPWEFQVIEA